ncbi:MAG: iron ABC transporter permease [Pseudomonadota bacterium]
MNVEPYSLSSPTQLIYQRRRRGRLVLLACACLLILGALLSVMLGPLDISAQDIVATFASRLGLAPDAEIGMVQRGVIEQIRLPRALLGALVGASLGASGAIMQGFFRNPLADPGLIGVSAGGALAAVAFIVLGAGLMSTVMAQFGSFALPVVAFLGSLATVFIIYQLANLDGRVVVTTMLLAGVAANAMAVSGIGYLTFLADDTQLRDLTLWTLGTLGGATWERVLPAAALMVIGLLGMLRLSRPMNALLLGEADAGALGVNVERVKRQAALLTALSVGAATAVCGIVAFVGLVVPHLVRLVTGPDHRYVLPGSALLGAALMLFADLVARLSVAPAELPLGVVTAAVGGPFFIWLLLRDKHRHQAP